MLLSQLKYHIIKKVLGVSESDFTYKSYLNNNFRDDYRVKELENSVILPINEAIARLNDLQKITNQVFKLTAIDSVVVLPLDVKEVIAVQNYNGEQYEFIKEGLDKIRLVNAPHLERLLVELSIDTFLENDQNEKELRTLGITNQMCGYIVDYVVGKIFTEISPNEASGYLSSAESYFSNIPTAPRLLKPKVKAQYKM
jgi:hypothetical protein